MGIWKNLWRKTKSNARMAFSRKGVFGSKGIVRTGNIFKKKGWNEVRKFANDASNTAGQVLDEVDDIVNKIEDVPIIGAYVKPYTAILKQGVDVARIAGTQAKGIAQTVDSVGGRIISRGTKDVRKSGSDLRGAKADVARRIAEVRSRM